MSINLRLKRVPYAFDRDRAAELDSIVPWASGPLLDLLRGAGGSSPYLKLLIERERGWLEEACADPEGALDAELEACRACAHDKVSAVLRRGKRRIALIAALCDLGGVWPLAQVTGTLTRFADLAVEKSLKAALAPELRRGKIPGATEDDLETAAGMFVLAMGKMGAFELNYSSDIDLICLFDDQRYDKADYFEARTGFVKATRKMCRTLSDVTGDGYVFRTDLRLRPDPSVTPVCLAMSAAERYYESLGRAWERAAHVKARPCAGNFAAGDGYLKDLKPFVWRKHLDFTAIQDAHDMRLRIREHNGFFGPITLNGHNMKLGRGGIREIEFFTQTRQIIAGGRDPALRLRGTEETLAVLADKGWVPKEAAETLTENYKFHREVEHRLQMIADAQTHNLPTTPEGFARLAALMGRDETGLKQELADRLETVHGLIESFFEPQKAAANPVEQSGLESSPIPERWPNYPALRSERAVEIFNRLKPEILLRLARAAKPEEALLAFDGFLAGLPAGVQLFSLFEANPQLIELLVEIASVSPDLAKYLSRNSAVFDAVIVGDFFAPWPGTAALLEDLTKQLNAEPDYERKLDLSRRWRKEWHFRIGVHLLRGLMSPLEAGTAYSELAEACIAGVWPEVQTEFARKHGPLPGRGAIVLGMGSLGAGRLHAHSDLDVIVIYDADGVEASEGARSLPTRTYYTRLTQSLITAVTAPMAEGKLYEMDMRLRPSGKKGPLAVSWNAYQTYQKDEAWTWEHMALTRARVIGDQGPLAKDVALFRTVLLAQPRDVTKALGDLADMRARIQSAKGMPTKWDAKLGAGRMQDIELFSQVLSLLAPAAPLTVAESLKACPRLLVGEDAAFLADTYEGLWALQVTARLICDELTDPANVGDGARAFLLRATGADSIDALATRMGAASAAADEVISRRLPQRHKLKQW